jgi:hypothetical protein
MTPFCPACESSSELKQYRTFSFYYCPKCKEDVGLVKPKPYRIGVGSLVELIKPMPHVGVLCPSGEYRTINKISYIPDGELYKTTYHFEEGDSEAAERTLLAIAKPTSFTHEFGADLLTTLKGIP